MTDRRDDDFRVRPSAPKNRGKGQSQSFVSKVLKQAGKASKRSHCEGHRRKNDKGPTPRSTHHQRDRAGEHHTGTRARIDKRVGPCLSLRSDTG